MKKILLAMAAIFSSITMSFAQNNLVATLQHEGTFTHYYGSGALTSAYNDATEGDIITLSPGTFSSPGTIDKGITLRGTGVDAAEKAYVSGTTNFCSTDSNRVLTVEGMEFNGECYVRNNAVGRRKGQGKIRFIKNKFAITFSNSETYSEEKGPQVRFYNCYVYDHFIFNADTHPDVFVYNSFVVCPWVSTYGNFVETTSAFVNCVVHYNSDHARLARNLNFNNCIFTFGSSVSNWSSNYRINNTSTCNNCVSLQFETFFSNQIYGSNNMNIEYREDLFSEAEGHKEYELTEEAQKTYLGLDGTQVGFYGGNYPYNTKVQYPIITQFSSDVQTSKEGILNINVEVDGK